MVNVFRSIEDIGLQALETLNDDDPFFSYEWFKILENQKCFPNTVYYVAVYDNNVLIALAPCFEDWANIYFFAKPPMRFFTAFLQKLLILGNKFGFCQNHMLLCYSPSCGRSKIIQKNTYNPKVISDLITKQIDSLCKKERYLFSSFPFASSFDKRLIAALSDASYANTLGITNFFLDIKWRSFEDYLKSMNRNHRKNINRKIRAFKGNGIIIEEQDFSQSSHKQLSTLLYNLVLKYNKDATKRISPTYFGIINQYAGTKIKLFIAKKNDKPIGFSLLFRQGTTVDSWMCGFDYEVLSRTDYTYFNLVYYEPIKWAIKEGIKKINFRSEAARAKTDCACQPEQMSFFFKCHDSCFGSALNFLLCSTFWARLSKLLILRQK